ncbi:TonB-dependent receptor [Pedomonas sp. V897]|uniref:TonB-dependent receptor n=1 Tax=Pedomonas sp. V897 TaxID=3446482 RepID=UPI003EDF3AB9
MKYALTRASTAMCVIWAAAPALALAQTSTPASPGVQVGLDEIIVTARKRAESVQDVPVAVTALSGEQVLRQDLTNLEKIAARTPNFTVGRASNGSGAQMTLRGIGSSSTSIGIEQSVAVIVDGVYYGQGRTINEGFFDLERLEILKGPQALFFGKNATAGVVSITSADPGDELEIIGRARYEFKSEQIQGEAIASVPLNDTLGLRVSLRASKMYGGYYRNIAEPVTYPVVDVITEQPGTPLVGLPADREAPGEEELLGRITLKWTPNDQLTATLKASGTYNEVNNNSWNYVAFNCPTGYSMLLPQYKCDRKFVTHQNNLPAEVARDMPYAKKDGSLYNRYKSFAITGTVNYELPSITLTSVTNYNWNNNRWACACDFQSSSISNWATENTSYDAFSTEFRALTSYDGPVNVLVGGYYQKTNRKFNQWIMFGNVANSTASPANRYLATTKTSKTDGETVSGFGQVIWRLADSIEATAGVRYTHETKDSIFSQPYNNPALTWIFRPADDPDGLGVTTAKQSFNNWSPEATISWSPVDDVMLYAAFKTGYKSGGFSNSGINSKLSNDPLGDLTFEPEKAVGFEGGIKTTLLDRQLRFNVALYSFKYKDMQIDFFNSPIFAFQTMTADARTKGVEIEFEYAPQAVEGLNIHGSLNYNRARYLDFIAPCYAGQTPAAGCNLEFNAAVNAYTRQNLTGSTLAMAPKWTATLGASYEREVSNNLLFGIGVDARYSDNYLASGFGNPASRQKSYVNLDASVRVGSLDRRWELALLGKNLTNRFYATGVVDGPSTGGNTGTPDGFLADQLGFGVLPRTVQVQLSWRY